MKPLLPLAHTRSFHLVSITILSYRRPWPSARATDPVPRTRGAPDVIQSIYQALAGGSSLFSKLALDPHPRRDLSGFPVLPRLHSIVRPPLPLPYPPALLNLGIIREEFTSEDDCFDFGCACCCCARCRVADAEGSGVRVYAMQEGEYGGAYLRTSRSSRLDAIVTDQTRLG